MPSDKSRSKSINDTVYLGQEPIENRLPDEYISSSALDYADHRLIRSGKLYIGGLSSPGEDR